MQGPGGGSSNVIQSFLVGLGFQVNQSSLQQFNTAIQRSNQQVQQFGRSAQQGTRLWGQFFQQFQRAQGPQREHIETTQRLSKAYELLGINLKELASIVAGGTVAAAFVQLTKS